MIPSRDISQMISLATDYTPVTEATERAEDLERLIGESTFTLQKPNSVIQISSQVEGVIPFSKIGIPGPHGERIVERSKIIRDPLPDEKPPLIYDIDSIPKEVLGNSGFLEFERLTARETVIIKTERTADGYLRGYFGGRFLE